MFVLVAVCALGLTACSSDDGGGTTGAETGTTGTTGNDDCVDLTGEGATFTITISDFAFDPNCFTASASQGISIENQDAADHTFTITGTDDRRPDRRRPDLQRRADLGSREPGDLRLPVHAPSNDDGAGHDRRVGASEPEPLEGLRVALPLLQHLDVQVEEDLVPEDAFDVLACP